MQLILPTAQKKKEKEKRSHDYFSDLTFWITAAVTFSHIPVCSGKCNMGSRTLFSHVRACAHTHTLTHTVACSHRCPHFLPPCCSLYLLLPVWVFLPAHLAALRIQVVRFRVSVFQNWYHTLHINQIRRRHFVYITFLSSSSYLRCVYTICNQTSLLWLFF